MEIAKVTAKGQITIPVDVRKRLGIGPGDKVVFVEQEGSFVLYNAAHVAIDTIQSAMLGAAERAGIKTEEDVARLVQELRRDRNSSS